MGESTVRVRRIHADAILLLSMPILGELWGKGGRPNSVSLKSAIIYGLAEVPHG